MCPDVFCSVEQTVAGADLSYGVSPNRWQLHDLSKYYLSNGSFLLPAVTKFHSS
jgi:hypothetical protein